MSDGQFWKAVETLNKVFAPTVAKYLSHPKVRVIIACPDCEAEQSWQPLSKTTVALCLRGKLCGVHYE